MEGGNPANPPGVPPAQVNIDNQALAQAVAASVQAALTAQQGQGNALDAQTLSQAISTVHYALS